MMLRRLGVSAPLRVARDGDTPPPPPSREIAKATTKSINIIIAITRAVVDFSTRRSKARNLNTPPIVATERKPLAPAPRFIPTPAQRMNPLAAPCANELVAPPRRNLLAAPRTNLLAGYGFAGDLADRHGDVLAPTGST
jgi:hypothetical protein